MGFHNEVERFDEPCSLPPCGLAFGIDLIEAIDSPFAKRAADLLKTGQHVSYLNLSLPRSAYASPSEFRDCYLIKELMSKFPNLDTGVDREAVALKKFWEYEEKCRLTNESFNSIWRSGLQWSNPLANKVLNLARVKIQKLLGDFSWDEAEVGFGWGPGASTRLTRRHGDAYYKFQGNPETTASNRVLAEVAIARVPAWHSAGSRVLIVPGNSITTVPKNAKTDRTIGVEPCMNMYIQKGIGAMIRNRLRTVGVTLNDQEPNQRLAREGSLTGRYATIDLKGASDCVSTGFVEYMLPPDWFRACDYARSHRGVLDGKVFTYHKFSSMGNGFTFELESLLFWAICRSVMTIVPCASSRLCVYGDDIVIPVEAARVAIDMLAFCGFQTNEDKTFYEGPFRESCGKHYFLGHDVTPFYLRKEVEGVDTLWLALNSLRRFAARGHGGLSDERFEHVWSYYRDHLPKWAQKVTLPADVPSHRYSDHLLLSDKGDGGLVGNFDEAVPNLSTRIRVKNPGKKPRDICMRAAGWEGYVTTAYQRVREVRHPDDPYAVLTWLYRSDRRGLREAMVGNVALPREGWRRSKIIVTQWADLGPWAAV